MDPQDRKAQEYCAVNQHMPRDRFGIHRPEEIFQKVGKAVVFSKLDLRQGFLQVPVVAGHQAKNCYWVGNRLMAYRLMPFGLRNAHFQLVKNMELALAGLDHCAID